MVLAVTAIDASAVESVTALTATPLQMPYSSCLVPIPLLWLAFCVLSSL